MLFKLKDNSFRFVQLENKSCVKDLVFCYPNTNYLFSSDFSGEISLWDLRMSKSVTKYFDNIDSNLKCSIKLSKDGTYLYNGSKKKRVILCRKHFR